jgi:hypothetical protein
MSQIEGKKKNAWQKAATSLKTLKQSAYCKCE